MATADQVKAQLQAAGMSGMSLWLVNFTALAPLVRDSETPFWFVLVKYSGKQFWLFVTSERLVLLESTGLAMAKEWSMDTISQVTGKVKSAGAGVLRFAVDGYAITIDIVGNATEIISEYIQARATGTPAESVEPEPIRCPKCQSTQITAGKKGFGLGKAAAGGILLGPAGLLAGFAGSGSVEVTCLQCGNKWKPGKM